MIRFGFAGWMLVALAACGRGDEAKPPASSADTLSLAERRAAGGRIVFVSERAGAPQVYAIAPTGEGERRLSSGAGAIYPAAVSPDGRTVAAVSVREDAGEHGEQLMLLPVGSGAARPLGPASARARSPSWSRDGRWLVFESDRESFRDVYRIAADGSGLRRLTNNAEGNFDPDLSPDGQSIAFASSRDGDAEVYVMRADGGEQRRLTAFHRDDWGPRWSPDGRTIAFLSNREGADRIFLVSADGTGFRRLSPAAAGDSAQEADIAWSPDGARIAFALHLRAGESRIRIVDVRTGAVAEVRGPADASQPAWSPHGRLIVFTAGAGDAADLWIARADGSGATRLTRAPRADWLPRWVK